MSSEKTTLEIIAPTPEEAISRGLNQLGLPQEAVEVEVLDTGSRGLFGLGSRQARVRLTIKPVAPPIQPIQPPARPAPESQTSRPPAAPRAVENPAVEMRKEADPRPAVSVEPVPAPAKEGADKQDTEMLRVAEEVVSELLDKMMVKAEVKAGFVEPVDENDQELVMVEVRGDDLSILIGRRSETLNALQYVASLIVSKELGRWVPMSIDVQGYRARRERQLRILARRMAEQALHTGRKQTLEPMPANERRLVHLELRDHPDVYTESVGEEPNRKVVILLKKAAPKQ